MRAGPRASSWDRCLRLPPTGDGLDDNPLSRAMFAGEDALAVAAAREGVAGPMILGAALVDACALGRHAVVRAVLEAGADPHVRADRAVRACALGLVDHPRAKHVSAGDAAGLHPPTDRVHALVAVVGAWRTCRVSGDAAAWVEQRDRIHDIGGPRTIVAARMARDLRRHRPGMALLADDTLEVIRGHAEARERALGLIAALVADGDPDGMRLLAAVSS